MTATHSGWQPQAQAEAVTRRTVVPGRQQQANHHGIVPTAAAAAARASRLQSRASTPGWAGSAASVFGAIQFM